ncbi:Do family serine endopeptidase [Candidatus Omnitrophota bacterium]
MFSFTRRQIFNFFVVTLTIGAVAGLIIAARLDMSPDSIAALPETHATQNNSIYALENAFIKVSEEVGPAVVSISAVHITKGGGRNFYFGSPFGRQQENPFEDDLFDRFFEDFFGESPRGGFDKERRQMGLGSGFIIDDRGFILTNQHVVEDADKITVTLPDGREFEAEVKGTDPRSDLAVIKIDAKNLPTVPLGDSDDLRIGQWVIAIGNPFGYVIHSPEPTITTGVISALRRSLPRTSRRDRDYSDLIQTDAAINPGNSGGPLVNLNGEVVGINVAIFTTSGGYQGIGFAIPVNTANRIVSRLIEGKKVLYGWLGVTVQDLDEELSEFFGVSNKEGVLIGKVFEDSPAQKAGLKSGDIILEFNGTRITDLRELLKFVGRAEVGTKAKVVVLRDKKEIAVTVEVGERPSDVTELTEKPESIDEGWRGIIVEDLTVEAAKRLQIETVEGVIVVAVDAKSPAAESGLRVGDVIDEINKKPIKDTTDFNSVTKGLKKENILVRTGNGYVIVKEK